jgi:hypothetical protein
MPRRRRLAVVSATLGALGIHGVFGMLAASSGALDPSPVSATRHEPFVDEGITFDGVRPLRDFFSFLGIPKSVTKDESGWIWSLQTLSVP